MYDSFYFCYLADFEYSQVDQARDRGIQLGSFHFQHYKKLPKVRVKSYKKLPLVTKSNLTGHLS